MPLKHLAGKTPETGPTIHFLIIIQKTAKATENFDEYRRRIMPSFDELYLYLDGKPLTTREITITLSPLRWRRSEWKDQQSRQSRLAKRGG